MTILRVDPADIRNGGDWKFHRQVGDRRYSRLQISDTAFVERCEYLEDETLVAQNKQSFDDSHGKRFGDGRVIASVPMHKFMRECGDKLGDEDHTKWWLNHEDNRPFRTFRGKV